MGSKAPVDWVVRLSSQFLVTNESFFSSGFQGPKYETHNPGGFISQHPGRGEVGPNHGANNFLEERQGSSGVDLQIHVSLNMCHGQKSLYWGWSSHL